jgi:hypothetical protein
LPAEGFNFLAQEKQDPYAYVVYTLNAEALKYAQAKNEQALSLLLKCEEDEDFKPYNLEGVQEVQLRDLY